MTVGLENRGVAHGVHDFRQGQRTREEYHQLLTSHAGDTRSRLFGTEPTTGTINARTRALSCGLPGHNPKGEYRPGANLEASQASEPAVTQKVTGGFIVPFQGNNYNSERTRRNGSLGRNIVGNSTIKDDRFVYYGGQGGSHYGHNSGSHNTRHYQ
mmetsp:Transcript_89961/g.279443  ORF Transcript_89961/g.279443 Transcript_89961/m.279443 type:complete len:156 (+) Transcript_89961:64-531(+)